jgi:hypothetical protein
MHLARPDLSLNRNSLAALAVLAVLLLAGCGNFVPQKPNPAGDSAFVAKLKQLCSKTPALTQIDPSASMAAITTATNADSATVANFEGGILNLTPSLSSTSPLAARITDLAEMLTDMTFRYRQILAAAKIDDTKLLSWMPAVAVARENQARSDLAKLGATSCLS